MQTYIKSYQHIHNEIHLYKIFSYSSRGVPGLEVVGFGNHNKHLKEKIVYISKLKELLIPNKKYTICLDQKIGSVLVAQEAYNFELPISILFWKMIGAVKFENLNNCYASGYYEMDGTVKTNFFPALAKKCFNNSESVILNVEQINESVRGISVESLFSNML